MNNKNEDENLVFDFAKKFKKKKNSTKFLLWKYEEIISKEEDIGVYMKGLYRKNKV